MADLIKQRNIDPDFLKEMHLGKLTEFDFEDNLRLKLANLDSMKISYDDTALVAKVNSLESKVNEYKNQITKSSDFYGKSVVDSKIAELRALITANNDSITSLKNSKRNLTDLITYDMLNVDLKRIIENASANQTSGLASQADLESLRQQVNGSVSSLEQTVNNLSSTFVVRNEADVITYNMLNSEVKGLLTGEAGGLTLNNFTTTVRAQLQRAIDMSRGTAGSSVSGGGGISQFIQFDAIATNDKSFYDAMVNKAKTFTATTSYSNKTLSYRGNVVDLCDYNYIIYLDDNLTDAAVPASEYYYNTLMGPDGETEQQSFSKATGLPETKFTGLLLFDNVFNRLYYVQNSEMFTIVNSGGGSGGGGAGAGSSETDSAAKTTKLYSPTIVQQEATVPKASSGGVLQVELPIDDLPATISLIKVEVLDRSSGQTTSGKYVDVYRDPTDVVYYALGDGNGTTNDSRMLYVYNQDIVDRTIRYVYMTK